MTERKGGQEERVKKKDGEKGERWEKCGKNCQKASLSGKFRGGQGGERGRQREIRMC